MNLVIDDAIEVKQPTKTDTEEKRRELGTFMRWESWDLSSPSSRANLTQRR